MHTIQLILVEADTAQDAFSYIEGELENSNTPSWSDWHNASNASEMNFAGRWSGGVFLTAEQKAEQEAGTLDTSTIPNHLCYADDPELADEVISQFLGWRRQAMREAVPVGLPDLDELIANYDPSADVTYRSGGFAMELWKLHKLTELLNDDWTYESAIYDLSSWTANLAYFHARCAKNPEKQFLIPVDFHH